MAKCRGKPQRIRIQKIRQSSSGLICFQEGTTAIGQNTKGLGICSKTYTCGNFHSVSLSQNIFNFPHLTQTM